MSAQCETIWKRAAGAEMPFFERYLSVWVALCIVAGILLAAAPCTAMVFVWSNLSDGHPGFTLSQVALNDLIMVFAFAPIVALLLGISSIVAKCG